MKAAIAKPGTPIRIGMSTGEILAWPRADGTVRVGWVGSHGELCVGALFVAKVRAAASAAKRGVLLARYRDGFNYGGS